MLAFQANPQLIGSGAWAQTVIWQYRYSHPDITSAGTSFTILRSGLYRIHFRVMFRNDVSSNGVRGAEIRHNGTPVATYYTAPVAAQADYVSAAAEIDIDCAAGTVITFWALQNSGGSVNLNGGLPYTTSMIRRVGPHPNGL